MKPLRLLDETAAWLLLALVLVPLALLAVLLAPLARWLAGRPPRRRRPLYYGL